MKIKSGEPLHLFGAVPSISDEARSVKPDDISLVAGEFRVELRDIFFCIPQVGEYIQLVVRHIGVEHVAVKIGVVCPKSASAIIGILSNSLLFFIIIFHFSGFISQLFSALPKTIPFRTLMEVLLAD